MEVQVLPPPIFLYFDFKVVEEFLQLLSNILKNEVTIEVQPTEMDLKAFQHNPHLV